MKVTSAVAQWVKAFAPQAEGVQIPAATDVWHKKGKKQSATFIAIQLIDPLSSVCMFGVFRPT